jgi:hypothetical protein
MKLPRESLYGNEEVISRLVLGPGRLREWRDRVPILERQGLPRIDALFGGRYVPAVLAFFDRLNGVSERPIPMGCRISGAITEASTAGADDAHLRSLATHKSLKMTQRYNRPTLEKNTKVAQLRVAHRQNKGT